MGGAEILIRSALYISGNHPWPIQTMLMLLWSLNEQARGRDGLDIEQPDLDWMGDILEYAAQKAAAEKETFAPTMPSPDEFAKMMEYD